MNKKLYCPNCEADNTFQSETRMQTCDVRNEKITIDIPLWVCDVCNETVVDESYGDPIDHAFDLYRNQHNLLSPNEIKSIRTKWNISQVAFATLLGMSQATINRYEGGSLQQEKEDVLLRACEKKEMIENLFALRGNLLTPRQQHALRSSIENTAELPQWSINTENTIESGFTRFEYEKYVAVVLWLCDNIALVTPTKLNKLLFYTDFLFFKLNACSMTGMKYRRMQFGPVPEHRTTLRAMMEEDGYLSVIESTFQNGNYGEVVRAGANEPSIQLGRNELHVLQFVRDSLGGLSPSEISDLSHTEIAWKETETDAFISYSAAIELSLSVLT